MRLTLIAVLENAEKYSPPEKPIDVRVERKHGLQEQEQNQSQGPGAGTGARAWAAGSRTSGVAE